MYVNYKEKKIYNTNFLKALILRDDDTRNKAESKTSIIEAEGIKISEPAEQPIIMTSVLQKLKTTLVSVEDNTFFTEKVLNFLKLNGFTSIQKMKPEQILIKDDQLCIMSSASVEKYAINIAKLWKDYRRAKVLIIDEPSQSNNNYMKALRACTNYLDNLDIIIWPCPPKTLASKIENLIMN